MSIHDDSSTDTESVVSGTDPVGTKIDLTEDTDSDTDVDTPPVKQVPAALTAAVDKRATSAVTENIALPGTTGYL